MGGSGEQGVTTLKVSEPVGVRSGLAFLGSRPPERRGGCLPRQLDALDVGTGLVCIMFPQSGNTKSVSNAIIYSG